MFSQAIDLSHLGTTVGSTTAATKSANAMDPEASQDRFLKLLVAQLNNQDPLNPMDNAQMTTQMAQINTVSDIQELNATLKGMASQAAATQSLQGASLIGRDALIEGDSLSFDGSVARGAVSLDSGASQVYVDIFGANGERIDTIDMGALEAGQHPFEWDAGDLDLAGIDHFEVRASNGSEPVEATSLSRQKVASVSFNAGSFQIQLQNGRTLTYDQVRAFM
ncbi:MAG: flagellar hook capping FlgD N-terminal domain-containing protein [Burkholderiaceae bacterium]